MVSPDFKNLLRLFGDYQVRYLIVGGYAVIKYTEPRYTKDLDVWVKADLDNAKIIYFFVKDDRITPKTPLRVLIGHSELCEESPVTGCFGAHRSLARARDDSS